MRSYLKEGTWVRFPDGECYEIIGSPIGEGGTGIIYPAVEQCKMEDGHYQVSKIDYVIKECYPACSTPFEPMFIRTNSGEIRPEHPSPKSLSRLYTAQRMQQAEKPITNSIYQKGFRLIPILKSSRSVQLSFDHGSTFVSVPNTVTVMESLEKKGQALKSYFTQETGFPAVLAFHVMEQILFAVREIHRAGYLHLDIQEGNIFIKGSLTDNSDMASLIDFGSSQKYLENDITRPIDRETIFTTYAPPEILSKDKGILYLGPETDIYSIGCILFLLLTGQKFVPKTSHLKNGFYLTKSKLKHINCPKHLVEKMQQILAKALAENPENRYHSCDEMLVEVSDFAKALQPYRSDLSQVAYDAFICYRHGAIDSKAAEALQKNLEHFRPPKELRKAGKRIRRIFVDKGELSSCSDFNLQTREALKNAGFLIVICSPGTKNSDWVNYEIDTFLEFHDRSRMLAVMTSGEAENIFPRKLLGSSGKCDEVLAADARGQDLHTVLKLLKNEALLQIAAPILGTTYDSLKQRHRIYRLQRIATASFTVLIGLIAFIFYQSWQSALINQQYQQARRNQARYTASISQSLLAEGDREKALLTALAIQPDNDKDGPVVPEQMYALNNALASYKDGLSVRFDPAYVGETDGVSYAALSPDDQYCHTIDESGNAAVLSSKTGKLLWFVTPLQVKNAISNFYPYHNEKFDRINLILSISEKEFAVVLNYCIAKIDLDSQEVIHVFPLDAKMLPTECHYDKKDNLLAFSSDSGKLYVYDLITGERRNYLNLNENRSDTQPQFTYTIESISFNEEKNVIALGLSYTLRNIWDVIVSGQPLETESQLSELPYAGLILYELDTQTTTIVSEIPTCKVQFTDDSHIAAIHFISPAFETVQKDIWGQETFSYYQALYDITTNCISFQGEPVTLSSPWNMGLMAKLLTINQNNCFALISWIRGNLTIVDIHSGTVLRMMSYRSDIIGISVQNKKYLFIGLADGSVQRFSLDSVLFSQKILSLDANISLCEFNQTEDTIILCSGRKLIFCNEQKDPEMKRLQLSIPPNNEEDSPNTTRSQKLQILSTHSEYIELAGQVYRCLYFEGDGFANIAEIRIYPVHSDEFIYRYVCPNGEYKLNNIGFGSSQNEIYVSFVETTPDNKDIFVKASLTTQATFICEDVSTYETLRFNIPNGIVYSEDMNTMYVKRFKGVVPFDISGNTLIPAEDSLLPRHEIHEMMLTGDGRHLILTTTDYASNKLTIYDYLCETKTLTKLAPCQDMQVYKFSNILFPGQASSLLGVYDGGKTILVIDCSDHSIVATIDTDNNSRLAFFDNDHYLIVVGQNTVNLYDLDEKKITYTYTYPEAMYGTIITDSNNHYFGLKNTWRYEYRSHDSESNRLPLLVFYVDDNHAFFPYAQIDFGYASFSGNEICSMRRNSFTYSHLYDYAYLKEKALSVLDGKVLTIEEQQEYFIESYHEKP